MFRQKTIIIFKLIIAAILILSVLSYERHAYYRYYTFFQGAVSVLIIVLSLLCIKYNKSIKEYFLMHLKNNILVFLILLLMILSTAIGLLLFNLCKINVIVNILFISICGFFMFFILPILLCKNDNIKVFTINLSLLISLFLGILAIIINFRPGFAGYRLVQYRTASILFDPNFLAMILGLSACLIFCTNKKRIIKILYLVFMIYVIYLTGSRGGFLSLILAFMVYLILFSKQKIYKKIILLILAVTISYYIINVLTAANFFRINQGDNGRMIMIKVAINGIKDSYGLGYGYSAIGPYLNNHDILNASTHNSFIDFLFQYGIFVFVLYIFTIIKTMIKGINYNFKNILYLSFIYMIINMNTVLYSFGGVGYCSLFFSIIFGCLNLKIIGGKNEI